MTQDTQLQNSSQHRRFTHLIIPAEIWLHENLSMQAKCLWAEIFSLSKTERGGCYASDDYLCSFMQLKRSRLHEILKELRDAGLLVNINFDGRRTVRRALVPEIKYENHEMTGQQESGKPDTSNPENRTPNVRDSGQLDTPQPYIYSKEQSKEEKKNIKKKPPSASADAEALASFFGSNQKA